MSFRKGKNVIKSLDKKMMDCKSCLKMVVLKQVYIIRRKGDKSQVDIGDYRSLEKG